MQDEPEPTSTAFKLGAYAQGILIGIPLFFALIKLLALAKGASVFRYQAF
ncbi:MAG: hypothetical protein R3F61_24585 [Myxococcota bacterium]